MMRYRAWTVMAGLVVAGCTSAADTNVTVVSPPSTASSIEGAGTTADRGTAHPPVATTTATAPRWVPAPRTTWQWQLSGRIDTSVEAQVFDIDGVDVPDAVLAELKAKGRRLVCYTSAGTAEVYRDDYGRYPAEVLGKPLPDWPDERWVDIRRLDVLGPILADRFAACRARGFDAVEPDNVDAYDNDSGFPLTPADQVAFNIAVADLAHRAGLSVGLKNAVGLVRTLEPYFDFAVNEQCYEYAECDRLSPFVQAGKAVFHVEYDVPTSRFCPATTALGFSSMRKRISLDAWRQPCPG